MISHPFEVGKTYRNRNGEYVVQALEGNWMKIRYAGGGTLETRVDIQARIWENIQFEEQLAREEERQRLAREARAAARQRTARARRARRQPKFEGFEESDFEPKKRGIAWSGRKELGKFLANELDKRTRGSFDFWIVPRESKVHVARKQYYNRDTRETNAAFFIAVDEKGVTYGFRVARPDGKPKAKGHWSAFVAALANDEKIRQALRSAMEAHDLDLDVYAMDVSFGRVGRVTVHKQGFQWQHETADQETTQQMDGLELAEYLQTLAPNKRGELRLGEHISPGEALEAGADIASEITAVLEALVPLYDVSVVA